MAGTSYNWYKRADGEYVMVARIGYEGITTTRFVAGKETYLGTYVIEVDAIPEYGLIVTLSAKLEDHFVTHSSVTKALTFRFYSSENNSLPMNKTVSLSLYINENEFLSSTESLLCSLDITRDVRVLLENGETEMTYGGGGDSSHADVVRENSTISLLSHSLFGMGIGVFLIGAFMLVWASIMKIKQSLQKKIRACAHALSAFLRRQFDRIRRLFLIAIFHSHMRNG
jgi:hypothetical protein